MATEARNAVAAEIESADASRLLAVVERDAANLDAGNVRRILRHPFLTAEIIETLLAVPRLRRAYEVRSRVARHPKTPVALASRLVPDLYWRDLVETSIDMRLAPTLRRMAERYLVERLPRLAIGERIAVARRAGAQVLARLRHDPDPRVVSALLVNPRLTEGLVLPLASNASALPQVLDALAKNDRWAHRYAVRRAMALNPQTPFAAQRRILAGLRVADLEQVARSPALSSIVRRWARDAIGARRKKRL